MEPTAEVAVVTERAPAIVPATQPITIPHDIDTLHPRFGDAGANETTATGGPEGTAPVWEDASTTDGTGLSVWPASSTEREMEPRSVLREFDLAPLGPDAKPTDRQAAPRIIASDLLLPVTTRNELARDLAAPLPSYGGDPTNPDAWPLTTVREPFERLSESIIPAKPVPKKIESDSAGEPLPPPPHHVLARVHPAGPALHDTPSPEAPGYKDYSAQTFARFGNLRVSKIPETAPMPQLSEPPPLVPPAPQTPQAPRPVEKKSSGRKLIALAIVLVITALIGFLLTVHFSKVLGR